MSKQDDHLELMKLRANRKSKKFWRHGDLFISEKDRDAIRDKYCAGCGKEKEDPQKYFGEIFCGKCVWKFKNGER